MAKAFRHADLDREGRLAGHFLWTEPAAARDAPQGGKLTKSKTLTNPQYFSCKVSHLRGHGISAFFASPFEEAALLSIDGSGDFTTTMIAIGKGK